jgi:hypothetical protein
VVTSTSAASFGGGGFEQPPIAHAAAAAAENARRSRRVARGTVLCLIRRCALGQVSSHARAPSVGVVALGGTLFAALSGAVRRYTTAGTTRYTSARCPLAAGAERVS